MMATKYEFAIKKNVLNSGKTIFTPVCRKKSRLGRLFSNPWQRITMIYDKFILMELDFEPELTYGECDEHIQGYQQVLSESVGNKTATIEYHALEEKEI